MLWFALTALAACAGALVALPFLRTRHAQQAAATPIDVYKAQLNSIVRDEASGDVDPTAAAELRTEVERRILDAPAPAPSASPPSVQFDRVTAAAVALIVVLGSAVLYAATGAPQTQSAAHGRAAPSATTAAAQSLPDVDTMIQRLRARLENSPNDAEGWRMLGWSYFETNHFAEAVEAYRRAVLLAPQEASYKSALAEAVTQGNGGSVTADARRNFSTALSSDPHDERAHYYLALAKAQSGDTRGAINDWIAGVRAAAPDSPWAPRMRESAKAAARQIGLNIDGRMPPASAASATAPPLSPDVVAQAQQAPPEAQQQMIAGMVDGLEQRLTQNPRDADGWVRLMRSRMVLGQSDRASAALQSALHAFNGDRPTQQRMRAAAAELNVPGA